MKISFYLATTIVLPIIIFSSIFQGSAIETQNFNTPTGTQFNMSYIVYTGFEPNKEYRFENTLTIVEFGTNISEITSINLTISITDSNKLGEEIQYKYYIFRLSNDIIGTSNRFTVEYKYLIPDYEVLLSQRLEDQETKNVPDTIMIAFTIEFMEFDEYFFQQSQTLTEVEYKRVIRQEDSSNREEWWYLLPFLAIPLIKKWR